ncbi:polyisoprenoid-binding protein [Halarcobacter bivalviorum]|uniref:Polyisoprenoid-binding protein n=1 Tax=Halarcobacter bivalviorum TaxID=663364 RepID=A0AAX2A881_9BACT|nr:YceI-like domain-containing periplasmic protein [Halarcobacter bivalviorum]RXK09670.1 polyisoprenoid-binding protein [Halarcobacter bivalviorum]
MKLLSKILLSSALAMTLANATPHTLDNMHTDVGFSVKHLMITNVKGNFTDYEGKIDFDYKTKTFNALEAKIKATSVNTGIEKRDNHLRSDDFFAATKYPEITFKMKSYKAEADEGVMTGDLTIRGITKEVELDVEDIATIKDLDGNNRVGFTLEGKINRMDFDLKWNKALEFGGVAVSETVKLIIEVQAVEK